MRILFISYEFPPLGGGGGTTCKYLAKALAATGTEIKVLTAGFSGLPLVEKIDGYEIRRVKCRRTSESHCSPLEMISFVVHAVLPMLRLIRSFKPAVIHIFFALPTGPLGWLAAKMTGVPYIVYLLGGDVPGFLDKEIGWQHRMLHGVSRAIWSSAARVVANSEGLRRLGEKAFPDIKVDVITNGIDTTDFCIQTGLPERKDVRLLFIGRLVDQKGLPALLEALSSIVNTSGRTDITLCVVGDGPQKSHYQQYIDDHKLNGQVEFTGWVKLSDLMHRYNASDIFVLPSTFEGMPSVVLQAMACGVPVVSTRVFGSEDLVVDGFNGYLVGIGDSKAMAERLQYLADHPEQRHAMGMNARNSVIHYDWRNIADRFNALYAASLG